MTPPAAAAPRPAAPSAQPTVRPPVPGARTAAPDTTHATTREGTR